MLVYMRKGGGSVSISKTVLKRSQLSFRDRACALLCVLSW